MTLVSLASAIEANGSNGEMQAFLGAECVLEHVRRFGEGLVDVAAPQLGIEREIGVALPLEMLEVGEACRPA